jgi:hypothetical protein
MGAQRVRKKERKRERENVRARVRTMDPHEMNFTDELCDLLIDCGQRWGARRGDDFPRRHVDR